MKKRESPCPFPCTQIQRTAPRKLAQLSRQDLYLKLKNNSNSNQVMKAVARLVWAKIILVL